MITKHATVRQQQRGITDLQVLLLKFFGEQNYKGCGVSELRISKKRRAEIVQALDKATNKALVISIDSETIITAYNKF